MSAEEQSGEPSWDIKRLVQQAYELAERLMSEGRTPAEVFKICITTVIGLYKNASPEEQATMEQTITVTLKELKARDA